MTWWGGYHKLFVGRRIPGNIATAAIYKWQCHTCWLIFDTEQEVQKHLKRSHPEVPMPPG